MAKSIVIKPAKLSAPSTALASTAAHAVKAAFASDTLPPFVLRTSDRLLFRRCRRLWGWMSHLKQGRVLRSLEDYFWLGTGIHYALEDFHGLNFYEHPAKAFLAYAEATRAAGKLPGTWQENQVLGIALMSYYADHWLRNRNPLVTYELNGIPQCEVNGAIDMGVKTRDGRRVLYGFTMDRIIIDEYERLWVCIAKDTWVWSPKGPCRIQDHPDAKFNGVKSTVTIKTNRGYELKCTPDHLVTTTRGDIEASKLEEWDELIVDNGPARESGNKDYWWTVGYWLGDGSLRNHGRGAIDFAVGLDREHLEGKLNAFFQPRGEKCRFAANKKTTGYVYVTDQAAFSDELRSLFASDWQYKYQKRLQIPLDKIENLPAFLQGLFDADGTVSKVDARGQHATLSVSTKSDQLARDIQVALANLSIKSSILKQEREPYIWYSVVVSSALSMDNFRSRIGFSLPRKQARLEEALANRGLRREIGPRVTSVEPSGDCEVYDVLDQPDQHFVANGLRVHNCEYKTAKQIRLYHFDVDEQITSYCVRHNAEALTRRGWRLHDELIIGEEVLGYNQETDRLEWTILEDIHRPGAFPTVTIGNKSFEFECTADHKWAQVNTANTANTWPAGKKTRIELKPIKEGQQHNYVVLSAPYEQGSSPVTPDEAAVIAWVLTDGSYQFDVSITQSRKKYAGEIQELLDRFSDCYSRITVRDDCNTWWLRAPFWRKLAAKAGLDFDLNGWEQFLLGLSPSALEAFCRAAMQAEGSIGASGQRTFCQNKGLKQDIFRLAFFLKGEFPSKGWASGGGEGSFPNQGICEQFTLGTSNKWTKTIKVTPNEGVHEVWCPQTKLGTWVMRQGSQVSITGNCWAAWRLYGRPVAGVIYQQHRKNIPTLPKVLASGKVSTDARQQTSAALYGKMLGDMYGSIDVAPKDNILCYNKYVMAEDEDKDRFVVRHRIERNERQLLSFEEKVYMELEEISREDLPMYPNPTKDCEFMCPLQAACVAMDDGSDWEGILNSYSIPHIDGLSQRDMEQATWRHLLPEPEDVQLPEAEVEYRQLLEGSVPTTNTFPEEGLSPEEAFIEEVGPLS